MVHIKKKLKEKKKTVPALAVESSSWKFSCESFQCIQKIWTNRTKKPLHLDSVILSI